MLNQPPSTPPILKLRCSPVLPRLNFLQVVSSPAFVFLSSAGFAASCSGAIFRMHSIRYPMFTCLASSRPTWCSFLPCSYSPPLGVLGQENHRRGVPQPAASL